MEEARGGNGEGGEDGGGCVADSGTTGLGRGVSRRGGGRSAQRLGCAAGVFFWFCELIVPLPDAR